MKNLGCTAICVAVSMSFFASIATAQEFNRTFGQGDTKCDSPSGTEIKLEYTFQAPTGYFFSDLRIEEQEPIQSFAGGDIGCMEWGHPSRAFGKTNALIGGKIIAVDVPVAVHVFAHADCGTNPIHIVQQDKIKALCNLKAVLAPLQ